MSSEEIEMLIQRKKNEIAGNEQMINEFLSAIKDAQSANATTEKEISKLEKQLK